MASVSRPKCFLFEPLGSKLGGLETAATPWTESLSRMVRFVAGLELGSSFGLQAEVSFFLRASGSRVGLI